MDGWKILMYVEKRENKYREQYDEFGAVKKKSIIESGSFLILLVIYIFTFFDVYSFCGIGNGGMKMKRFHWESEKCQQSPSHTLQNKIYKKN